MPEEQVTQIEGSVSTGIETQSSSSSASESFLSSIPSQYKDAEFVKDFATAENPTEALWGKFAGMHEALKAQPMGLPQEGAAPEEFTKWAQTIAPKDISAYGNLKPEITQENLKPILEQTYSSEFLTPMMNAARELGLQPFQLKGLMDVFHSNTVKAAEGHLAAQAQQKESLDKEFDALCTKQFGNEKEKVLKEGSDFLSRNVGKEWAPHVEALSNEGLAVVAQLAYNLKQKYGVEDKMPGANPIVTGISSVDEIRSKMSDLSRDAAFSNMMDPKHQIIQNQYRDLAAKLSKLQPVRKYGSL